ncbi:non-specific lipid transfer protein GPI-anchored 25 [Ricinus communis]|uniref:Lipid binding protein, putative n=1 Tax=Ricinus communis TaxID=3988 RepID=B9RTN3_RICCO|nr:non-specific lipid transfer protein GPI-anchored 25 [Ricinus communis]EEF45265.1 lipid binding protein, putative [Ricinus communis]|eukprot:XP_002517102.1 protein YLS3 [Ricinus communis]
MTTIFAPVIFLLMATASQTPCPPPPVASCTGELVAISPCLGYISSEPNNMTETPTSQCCDALEKAFSSSEGNCFCYLIKQPLIFGFPLNQSRVVSLPSVCSETTNFTSLESICSGSPALPPLHSITDPVTKKPSNSGNAENSSAPMSFTPTAEKLPPSQLIKPASHSSAAGHISSWFLPEALITSAAVFILAHL